MDMSLPTDQEMDKDPTKPDKPVDNPGEEPPPEEPPEVTVVVTTQHDGRNDGIISGINVTTNAGPTAIETPGGKLDRLVEHLKGLRETVGNKNDVKLQGDSRLKWEAIVRVRDACHKAGFINASFAPPPDLGLHH
jgi:hypothetical protein